MKDFQYLETSFAGLIDVIKQTGGRLIFVGGCVRDTLLKKKPKDYDAEVFGLSAEKLLLTLQQLGPVNCVGKSFQVFKLAHPKIDVSLPRVDTKISKGHRGFFVKANAFLDFSTAARRRDLTINSMGYDPIKKKILDPYAGQKDLKNKVLRAVDVQTFPEDPLRVLRVAQFAGRFQMRPDQTLIDLCRHINIGEVSQERIVDELDKLFLQGTKPSLGIDFLCETGIFQKLLPVTRAVSKDAIKKEAEKLDKSVCKVRVHRAERLYSLFFHNFFEEEKERIQVHSLKKLGFQKSRIQRIDLLMTNMSLLKKFSSIGDVAYLRIAYNLQKLDLSWADMLWILRYDNVPLFEKVKKRIYVLGAHKRWMIRPLVTASDLMKIGFSEGKELGQALAFCLDKQFQGMRSKARLIQQARERFLI